MKRVYLIPGVLILVIVVAGGGWAYHQWRVAHITYTRLTPLDPHPQVVVPNDWHEYHAIRLKVLHDNPDLAAEYKSLLAELTAEQKKLDAAMIKADPQVAPLLARLAVIRQQNTLSDGPPVPAK